MNPEVKKLWVEALRSPKYKQGQRSLRTTDEEYCCLGVLCDVSGLGKWNQPTDGYCDYQVTDDDFSSGMLPDAVQDWAGLKHCAGDDVLIGDAKLSLVVHNDQGRTFAEIADAIEAQL